MLGLALTAVLLVAASVAIHAFGTTFWIRVLMRHYAGPGGNFRANRALPAITSTALVLLMLHLIEVVVWALAYLLLLPGDHMETLEKATYFSIVTFTTLGYGDITLVEHDWRLLSGIESLIGVVLIGWTTALLFMVVQRSWRSMAHDH